jgi:hypothetical protein
MVCDESPDGSKGKIEGEQKQELEMKLWMFPRLEVKVSPSLTLGGRALGSVKSFQGKLRLFVEIF